MSSIYIRKIISNITPFAGRKWYYEFRTLPKALPVENCIESNRILIEKYSEITKTWTKEKNSEWVCRLYFSAKLILSATLHVNAIYFSENHNFRIVIPYLRYYAILSLLRAVSYTLPKQKWKNGKLIRISHADAIKCTIEYLKLFDKDLAKTFDDDIRELKAERELISYRAPTSGDDQLSEKNRFLETCTLLAEMSQLNSELFEHSLEENADPNQYVVLPDYMRHITCIEIDGHNFGDREDAYRLDYLRRKFPRPANIQHLMTEGFVEDFFGAWLPGLDSDSDPPHSFDPDENWGIIFNVP